MVRYAVVYCAFCECLWLVYKTPGQLFHVVHPLLCSLVRVSVCNQYWMANTIEPPREGEKVLKHTRSH